MAFNINAQIILSQPKNLNNVSKQISKQLGKSTKIDLKIGNVRQLTTLNKQLTTLNNSLTKLNSGLSSTRGSVSALGSSFNNTSRGVANAAKAQGTLATQVARANQSLKAQGGLVGTLGKRFGSVAKQAIAFGAISRPIYDLQRALTGAVKDAVAFEREIVKISQVTGRTVAQLDGLTSQITTLSKELGISANELAETSRVIAQAGIRGKDLQQVLNALARSTLAPTFGKITDTTEGLIAAFGQFGLKGKDAEKVLGSLNQVSKDFAVEAEDLISVIRRTGGVFAQAAGNTKGTITALQELTAVFTAVRSSTRESADTIAAGLRTIFSRIQRKSTISFLKQFGIDLVDAQGKFVGIFPAFDKLSQRLETLIKQGDALTLSAIAEELGGIRQIGKLLPAIAQFDKARKALTAAQKGAVTGLGTDVAKALDTIDNRVKRIRESFNALIRQVFESDAFQTFAKGFLSGSQAIIDAASSIFKTIEPILPLLTTLGTIKLGRAIGGLFSGGLGGALGSAASTVTGSATAQAAQKTANLTQTNNTLLSTANNTLKLINSNLTKLISVNTSGFRSSSAASFAGRRRASGGAIPKFADGGRVYGPSHAAGGVIAELEGGEYVIPKKYAQGTPKGGASKGRRGNRAYVFDFDDTLGVSGSSGKELFSSDPQLAAARQDKLRNARATSLANSAKKRSQQGFDVHVLTARFGTPKDEAALQDFLVKAGIKPGRTIFTGGLFKGEREPGKKPGTTRQLSTATKKARILEQLSKNYDSILFLDDAIENVIKAKDVKGVKPIAVNKQTQALKRAATGGLIPGFAPGGRVRRQIGGVSGVTGKTQIRNKTGENLGLGNDVFNVNVKSEFVPVATSEYNKFFKTGGQGFENFLAKSGKYGQFQGQDRFPVDFIKGGKLFDAKDFPRNKKLGFDKTNQITNLDGYKKALNYYLYQTFKGQGYRFDTSGVNNLTIDGRSQKFLGKRITAGQDSFNSASSLTFLFPDIVPDDEAEKGKGKKKKIGRIGRAGRAAGGIIQKLATGDIVRANSVGVAILDPDEVADGKTKISVKDVEAAIGFNKGTAPGKSGVSKVFSGKEYKIVKQGLNKKTSERFNKVLAEGLIKGVDFSASELSNDLGLGPTQIDQASKTKFIQSQRSAIRGDLFEAVLSSLNNRGKFDSAVDFARPFDFPNGLRGPFADNFSKLPSQFVDAKSSKDAAPDSNIRGKILRELAADVGKNPAVSEALARQGGGKKGKSRATGRGFGSLTFASGGEVPVRISNGEMVVTDPKEVASRRGELQRINKLATGGFASGTIARGPGTGTSDSIYTTLPEGAFVVNAASTKKYLGLRRGGGVQRLQGGGQAAGGAAGAGIGLLFAVQGLTSSFGDADAAFSNFLNIVVSAGFAIQSFGSILLAQAANVKGFGAKLQSALGVIPGGGLGGAAVGGILGAVIGKAVANAVSGKLEESLGFKGNKNLAAAIQRGGIEGGSIGGGAGALGGAKLLSFAGPFGTAAGAAAGGLLGGIIGKAIGEFNARLRQATFESAKNLESNVEQLDKSLAKLNESFSGANLVKVTEDLRKAQASYTSTLANLENQIKNEITFKGVAADILSNIGLDSLISGLEKEFGLILTSATRARFAATEAANRLEETATDLAKKTGEARDKAIQQFAKDLSRSGQFKAGDSFDDALQRAAGAGDESALALIELQKQAVDAAFQLSLIQAPDATFLDKTVRQTAERFGPELLGQRVSERQAGQRSSILTQAEIQGLRDQGFSEAEIKIITQNLFNLGLEANRAAKEAKKQAEIQANAAVVLNDFRISVNTFVNELNKASKQLSFDIAKISGTLGTLEGRFEDALAGRRTTRLERLENPFTAGASIADQQAALDKIGDVTGIDLSATERALKINEIFESSLQKAVEGITDPSGVGQLGEQLVDNLERELGANLPEPLRNAIINQVEQAGGGEQGTATAAEIAKQLLESGEASKLLGEQFGAIADSSSNLVDVYNKVIAQIEKNIALETKLLDAKVENEKKFAEARIKDQAQLNRISGRRSDPFRDALANRQERLSALGQGRGATAATVAADRSRLKAQFDAQQKALSADPANKALQSSLAQTQSELNSNTKALTLLSNQTEALAALEAKAQRAGQNAADLRGGLRDILTAIKDGDVETVGAIVSQQVSVDRALRGIATIPQAFEAVSALDNPAIAALVNQITGSDFGASDLQGRLLTQLGNIAAAQGGPAGRATSNFLNGILLANQKRLALAAEAKRIQEEQNQARRELARNTADSLIELQAIKNNTDALGSEFGKAVTKFEQAVDKLLNPAGATPPVPAGGGPLLPATGGFIGNGILTYRAAGGNIFKPRGTDTVPAMLTPGEYVVKKSSVDQYGPGVMQAINNGSAQVYASTGGRVGKGVVYRQGGGGVSGEDLKKREELEKYFDPATGQLRNPDFVLPAGLSSQSPAFAAVKEAADQYGELYAQNFIESRGVKGTKQRIDTLNKSLGSLRDQLVRGPDGSLFSKDGKPLPENADPLKNISAFQREVNVLTKGLRRAENEKLNADGFSKIFALQSLVTGGGFKGAAGALKERGLFAQGEGQQSASELFNSIYKAAEAAGIGGDELRDDNAVNLLKRILGLPDDQFNKAIPYLGGFLVGDEAARQEWASLRTSVQKAREGKGNPDLVAGDPTLKGPLGKGIDLLKGGIRTTDELLTGGIAGDAADFVGGGQRVNRNITSRSQAFAADFGADTANITQEAFTVASAPAAIASLPSLFKLGLTGLGRLGGFVKNSKAASATADVVPGVRRASGLINSGVNSIKSSKAYNKFSGIKAELDGIGSEVKTFFKQIDDDLNELATKGIGNSDELNRAIANRAAKRNVVLNQRAANQADDFLRGDRGRETLGQPKSGQIAQDGTRSPIEDPARQLQISRREAKGRKLPGLRPEEPLFQRRGTLESRFFQSERTLETLQGAERAAIADEVTASLKPFPRTTGVDDLLPAPPPGKVPAGGLNETPLILAPVDEAADAARIRAQRENINFTNAAKKEVGEVAEASKVADDAAREAAQEASQVSKTTKDANVAEEVVKQRKNRQKTKTQKVKALYRLANGKFIRGTEFLKRKAILAGATSGGALAIDQVFNEGQFTEGLLRFIQGDETDIVKPAGVSPSEGLKPPTPPVSAIDPNILAQQDAASRLAEADAAVAASTTALPADPFTTGPIGPAGLLGRDIAQNIVQPLSAEPVSADDQAARLATLDEELKRNKALRNFRDKYNSFILRGEASAGKFGLDPSTNRFLAEADTYQQEQLDYLVGIGSITADTRQKVDAEIAAQKVQRGIGSKTSAAEAAAKSSNGSQYKYELIDGGELNRKQREQIERRFSQTGQLPPNVRRVPIVAPEPAGSGPLAFNKGGEVPIMAQTGEFVMNRQAVQRNGIGMLSRMNQGLPTFHSGGYVGAQYRQAGGRIFGRQNNAPSSAVTVNGADAAKELNNAIITGGETVKASWQQLFDTVAQNLDSALSQVSTIPNQINATVAPVQIEGVQSFTDALSAQLVPKIIEQIAPLINKNSQGNNSAIEGDGLNSRTG